MDKACAVQWDYIVYTDGACINNPGPGGWAIVVINARDGSREEKVGSCGLTTNNRMELRAAIEGLRATPRGARVLLRTDSQLLANTINLGWKRKANLELWQALDHERELRDVTFEWVRGHADDPDNARADELANRAATIMAKKQAHGSHPAQNISERSEGRPPAPDESDQNQLLSQIKPLLSEDETVLRCLACGRLYVRSKADQSEPYCPLVTCQLVARQKS